MTLNPPKLHYFPSNKLATASWKGVLPGDGVIAPGTIAWRLFDFKDRYRDGIEVLKTKHRILLVVGVIDDELNGPEEGFKTFLVWSRHGMLCIIAPVK